MAVFAYQSFDSANSFVDIIESQFILFNHNRFENDHIWWLIYKNSVSHACAVCYSYAAIILLSERYEKDQIGMLSSKCKRFYSYKPKQLNAKHMHNSLEHLSHDQKCSEMCIRTHSVHSRLHYVSWNNSIIFPKHFDQLLQSMKLNRNVYGLYNDCNHRCSSRTIILMATLECYWIDEKTTTTAHRPQQLLWPSKNFMIFHCR